MYKTLAGWIGRSFPRKRAAMKVDFKADGLGVRRKNLSFLSDPRFVRAWEKSAKLNADGWRKVKGGVPDLRWRAHVCCWAAQQGLALDGDFVECGVHTGILSLVVADFVSFKDLPRKFWLFDTFAGIPLEGLADHALGHARGLNEQLYFDVFDIAKRNFADTPNAHLVKGTLPGSLAMADLGKIAYLSIDLNHVTAERDTIAALWDRIQDGAVIVIDDYAFQNHEDQYQMWNEFAASKGKMVLTLPTGQGLLIR